MFRLSVEKLAGELLNCPESETYEGKLLSEGQRYLFRNVCLPVLSDYEKEIPLDLDKFNMDDLDELADCYYSKDGFKVLHNSAKIAGLFDKCGPMLRKTAFI